MILIEFILFIIGGVEILVYTDGPLDLFLEFRNKLPKRVNPLLCEYCTSVWLGLIFSIFIGNGYLFYPLMAAGVIKVFNTVKDYFYDIKI